MKEIPKGKVGLIERGCIQTPSGKSIRGLRAVICDVMYNQLIEGAHKVRLRNSSEAWVFDLKLKTEKGEKNYLSQGLQPKLTYSLSQPPLAFQDYSSLERALMPAVEFQIIDFKEWMARHSKREGEYSRKNFSWKMERAIEEYKAQLEEFRSKAREYLS